MLSYSLVIALVSAAVAATDTETDTEFFGGSFGQNTYSGLGASLGSSGLEMGMSLLGKRGEGYGFGGFGGLGDRRPHLPEQQYRYEQPAPHRAPHRAPLPAEAPAPYSGPRGPYAHLNRFNEQDYLRANRA